MRRLADAGIPLGSQTVLLKGVNDDVETMKELMQRLLLMRVRPYYLYQCDPISGSSHFRTSIQTGLDIMEGLRGHTTGYGVPTYVVDAPGGGGKIPLQPQYVVGREGEDLILRNYEGREYRYPDPAGESRPSEGRVHLGPQRASGNARSAHRADLRSARRVSGAGLRRRRNRRVRPAGHHRCARRCDRIAGPQRRPNRVGPRARQSPRERRSLGTGVQHRRGTVRLRT